MGTGEPFRVGNLPGGEAESLHPSRAKVKNSWGYITTPYVFMA